MEDRNPLVNFLLIIIGVGSFIYAIFSLNDMDYNWKRGYQGDDGFYALQYQVNSANDAGFSVYTSPNLDSQVIRTVEQFETYSLGDETGAFIKIYLNADDTVGWVLTEEVDPLSKTNQNRTKEEFSSAFSAFFSQYTVGGLAFDIIFGIIISWGLTRLFGKTTADEIDTKLSYVQIVISATLLYFGHRFFFADPVHQIEYTRAFTSFGAEVWGLAFPVLLGAGVGELLNSRNKWPAIQGIILGFVISFAFFLVWGSMGGMF